MFAPAAVAETAAPSETIASPAAEPVATVAGPAESVATVASPTETAETVTVADGCCDCADDWSSNNGDRGSLDDGDGGGLHNVSGGDRGSQDRSAVAVAETWTNRKNSLDTVD